jgi:catechol 2,3-dioxygenase-like lactoylglutathione lyase family enzyme
VIGDIAECDTRRPNLPAAQLAMCVVYVRDLTASVEFYAEVLDLAVSVRTQAAAMLTTDAGCRLVLLETEGNSEPQVGAVGIQYVVWAAAGCSDLNNIDLKLKCLGARVSRQTIDGVTYVEGRDPNGLPIIVTNPSPHDAPTAHIFNRIYGAASSSDRRLPAFTPLA